MPRPPVTVIAPFAGSDAELDELAEALGRLERRTGDAVVVADNRRPPRPGRRGSIEVVDAGGPASAYFARDAAARATQGEWLVFVDADTRPEPDLLDAYFQPAPEERTAILAGGIEDWVRRPTRCARYVAARGGIAHARTLRHPRAPYAQTANCAIRRRAYEEVGGFRDPVRSGGDADLCWRLERAGWELEARPAARVRHVNRERFGDLLAQLHRHGAGMQWLERRWPGSFPPPGPRRVAGRVRAAAAALARGRSAEAALFALVDLAAAAAVDLGRLRANGDPTPARCFPVGVSRAERTP